VNQVNRRCAAGVFGLGLFVRLRRSDMLVLKLHGKRARALDTQPNQQLHLTALLCMPISTQPIDVSLKFLEFPLSSLLPTNPSIHHPATPFPFCSALHCRSLPLSLSLRHSCQGSNFTFQFPNVKTTNFQHFNPQT
jgi:hypothetical protein